MLSEPVVGEKFYGREEALGLLEKRAQGLKDGYRQNIALTGPSLVGKSSIIRQFLHAIKEEGFIPIYVEVVREHFKSFAAKFIATALYNALEKMGEAVEPETAPLVERAGKLMPRTCQAIAGINSMIDEGNEDGAYSLLLALTSTLKSETGIPCIVILDEFDNLERIGIRNPFLAFGKVIMVQKDTMYIVSSSRNDSIKKIISEKLSLLFGNFELIKVANFDIASSSAFLDHRLSEFDLPAGLKKFLIAFTGGNPFYLGKMTEALKTNARDALAAYIDNGVLVRSVVDLVYDSDGAISRYLSNYLLDLLDSRQRDYHMQILSAIASGANRKQEIARAVKTKQADALKALTRLSEMGLISKCGAFYKIEDPMLGFWLVRVRRRKSSILVDGAFDRAGLYRKEFLTYLSDSVTELGLSPSARIAELFNLFDGESIETEAGPVRFPHFTKVDLRTLASGGRYVIASFKGNSWVTRVYGAALTENAIIDYIRDVKALGVKVSNKIVVQLKGMEENARLLAKELKISIWDDQTANLILELYGKRPIVTL